MEAYAILAIVGLGTIFSRRRRAPEPAIPVPQERTGELLDYRGYQPEYTSKDALEEEARRVHESARAAGYTDESGIVDPRTRRLYEGQTRDSYYSDLAGHRMDAEDFAHNNMRPQYAKNTYKHSDRESDGLLEMFGTKEGPGNYMKKHEVGAMFDPLMGASYISGTPDFTAQYAERLEMPTARDNHLPFEQIRVGPGVGQGYTSEPTGGFTQPQDRDFVMPKTVDELRPLSNQKTVMEGRVIPGAGEPQRGLDPVFAKNRPETVFDVGERGMVPTAAPVDALALRPDVSHAAAGDTLPSRSYVTPAGMEGAPGRGGNWSSLADGGGESRIMPGGGLPPGPASSATPLPMAMAYDTSDLLPNQRSFDERYEPYLGAADAPVDRQYPAPERIMPPRLTGREPLAESKRVYGPALSPQMPGQGPAFDLGDPTRTTMRETQIHDSRAGNIHGPGAVYADAHDPSCRFTIREHVGEYTPTVNRKGAGGRTQTRAGECPPRTTGSQLLRPEDPTRLGLATMEHQADGYQMSAVPEAFATNRDASLTHYTGPSGGANVGGYGAFQAAAENSSGMTQRETLHASRSGPAGRSDTTKPRSYETLYNATVNTVREEVSRERFAGVQKQGSALGAESVAETRVPTQLPSKQRTATAAVPNPTRGEIGYSDSAPQTLPNQQRLDRDLLDFLNTNPFVNGPQHTSPEGLGGASDPQRIQHIS